MRAKVSIRQLAKAAAYSALILLAGCASAEAEPESICDAIQHTGDNLRQGLPVRVEVALTEGYGVACAEVTGNARRLCRAVVVHASNEYLQVLAWTVRDCVEQRGEITSVLTTNQPTGLRDSAYITQLRGRLSQQTRISFDVSDDNHYALTISR